MKKGILTYFIKTFPVFLQSLFMLGSYTFIIFFLNPGDMPSSHLLISMLELGLVLLIILLFCYISFKRLYLFIPSILFVILLWKPIIDFIGTLSLTESSPGLIALIFQSILGLFFILIINQFFLHRLKSINNFLVIAFIISALSEVMIYKHNFGYSDTEIRLEDEIPQDGMMSINNNINTKMLPHIIYVVPDRYGNLEGIKENFDFNNKDFYSELSERGFVVNEFARSNYPYTGISLASTLNGSYIERNKNNNERSLVFPYIRNNKLFESLFKLNYKIYNFDNWWYGTSYISKVSYSFMENNQRYFSKPTETILKTYTPFYSILNEALGGSFVENECNLMSKYLDEIENILSNSNDVEPKFVFAHLLMPHEPFLFDKNGNCNSNAYDKIDTNDYKNPEVWKKRQLMYADYMEYFNQRILVIFDKLSKETSRDIIFVIQADEGPYPQCFLLEEKKGNYKNCDVSNWEIKTGIMHAFYSSNNILDKMDIATPINNIKYILEIVTKQQFTKLQHHTFIVEDKNKRFDFKELEKSNSNSK